MLYKYIYIYVSLSLSLYIYIYIQGTAQKVVSLRLLHLVCSISIILLWVFVVFYCISYYVVIS